MQSVTKKMKEILEKHSGLVWQQWQINPGKGSGSGRHLHIRQQDVAIDGAAAVTPTPTTGRWDGEDSPTYISRVFFHVKIKLHQVGDPLVPLMMLYPAACFPGLICLNCQTNPQCNSLQQLPQQVNSLLQDRLLGKHQTNA